MVFVVIRINMIGIFDSGIGGLGIFDEIRKLMPNEQILYLADTKNCPYGDKTEQQIKQICLNNSRFLIVKGADIIVVACNTGSIIALDYIRQQINKFSTALLPLRKWKSGSGDINMKLKYPQFVSIVGVVPVVRTCSEVSKNKKIGILATKRTVESRYLRDLVEKFCPPTPRLRGINPTNHGFKVYYQAANLLVELVENYKLQIIDYESNRKSKTRQPARQVENLKSTTKNLKLLEKYLQLFKDKDVDTIALGCTHFPFLRQQIEQIMGDKVKILDSNGAVARQVERIAYGKPALLASRRSGPADGSHIANRKNDSSILLGTGRRSAIGNKLSYQFITTGNPVKLKTQIKNLIGLKVNKINKVDI